MKNLVGLFRDYAAKRTGEYRYQSTQTCACAQFSQHLGMFTDYLKFLDCGYDSQQEHDKLEARFTPLERLASAGPHTWEGLVKRIDKYVEKLESGKYEEPPQSCYRPNQSYFYIIPPAKLPSRDSAWTIDLSQMEITITCERELEDV